MQLAPESLRAPVIRDVIIEAVERELCRRSRDITTPRAAKCFLTVNWIHAITRGRHVFLDDSLLHLTNTVTPQKVVKVGWAGREEFLLRCILKTSVLFICTSEE
jgi:hypothetical protein